MRTPVLAVLIALAAPTAAPAQTADLHSGCQTVVCKQRVAKKQRIHRIYRFCNTWQCIKRVNKIRAARYIRYIKRYIAPYRGWLASVRACESGNNYAINTGNGFYGAYQFTYSSWLAAGGQGFPHLAAPLEQDYRAVRWLQITGRGSWPNCG